MKSNLTYSLVAAALCLMAGAAQAQVTLNVTGRITQSACAISVGTVALGDVPISAFESSATAPATYNKNFNVTLSGCQLATLRAASLSFRGEIVNDATTLKLTAVTGAAEGFGVRIRGSDSTHVNTAYANFSNPNSFDFKLTSAQNTFQFTASYYKYGSTMKPGTANATATVTLNYS